MEQRYIKLSKYAKLNCITYKTAWKRFNEGLLPNAFKDKFGNILVNIEEVNDLNPKNCVLYSRVSSNEMKDNLKRQEQRLINYAKENNFNIIKSFSEIGSGLNDNRPKLIKMLEQNDWNILIIENKDRLTRFGFNYLKTLLKKQNKEIIIINEIIDDKEDLMKDLILLVMR